MDVREKLVERLRDLAGVTPPICDHQKPEEIDLFGKNVTVYCKPFEQFQGLMREAADYIDHGATVQEWISVKDRLPDMRHDVLVSKTWWNERKPAQIGWYNEVTGNWYILTEDGYVINNRVTHWMPMPEPPKGE